MTDEELFEALVERSVFHEVASDVLEVVGDKQNSERERYIADLYEKMSVIVFHFENVCFAE